MTDEEERSEKLGELYLISTKFVDKSLIMYNNRRRKASTSEEGMSSD